jgi:hypothetical protein
MAHTCNSGYSRVRDQKDRGWKVAQANSSWGSISKKSSQKRGGGVAQGVGPEFKH